MSIPRSRWDAASGIREVWGIRSPAFAAADPQAGRKTALLVIRRVRHALVVFSMPLGALRAFLLHQLGAPLAILALPAAEGERRLRFDQRETHSHHAGNGHPDRGANKVLLKHDRLNWTPFV